MFALDCKFAKAYSTTISATAPLESPSMFALF